MSLSERIVGRFASAVSGPEKGTVKLSPQHPLTGCEVEIVRRDPFQRFIIVRLPKRVGEYSKGAELHLKPAQVESKP